MKVTIVIPAFHEAACIKDVLIALTQGLTAQAIDAEVIVVNDGSTDRTAEEAAAVPGVRVISHKINRGYGAALKTGIEHAQTEWVITYDSDGQHTPDLIGVLLPHLTAGNDMVVGKREGYKGPAIRQPGKKLLGWVANYLTKRKIPDLNSGLRAFRRDKFLMYAHLFPSGFSLSTTSTICFLKEGLAVEYVPITIQKRVGSPSSVKARHAWDTFMFILHLIMLFDPLRIFLPITAFFGIVALGDLLYEWMFMHNLVSKTAAALIVLTALTFLFGLLADQIAHLRREMHKRMSA